MSADEAKPLGFEVEHVTGRVGDYGGWVGVDEWAVSLPHQCGAWRITQSEDCLCSLPHAEAVAALERFIAEAQAALAALRRREEVGT